uniref:Uncharacterized protein n=1 Tax=Eucampia antarctica TaxID=49252 RepID=A0A7S2VZV9_9STRA|mmetsp:Transcript_16308/g.15755  ORF Transcript_16308/g.15755 Transcript_16308/m.15755 type:complete len:234 (+) Transcript_16308:82-783(+)|eukprot:CAMPEP_0197833420 /NCGR_PEP_ID=MMETSP1437-20131217/18981_1 /TAXON_ID=49252 ORGANISM="Eucampia antarctica, Strain CCMP1452" /NCGR_SAMPLE_ID=MMETSP1437 /ASSEMBLY_ACC=CAM_ASM_001096 /LENGTH=233 /DNA_ID=CAMNT_0043437475 /DNA_START=39 /DNA_END=740 /DNA_ORIENTATION=-
MGNKAAKEFKALELGTGHLDADGPSCISSKLVFHEKNSFQSTIKKQDIYWSYGDSSKVAFTNKTPSLKALNTQIITDAEGKLLAVIKKKSDLKIEVISFYCPTPCFDKQEATPEIREDPEGKDMPMYLKSIIERVGTFKVEVAAYMVTGVDESGEVTKKLSYTAEQIDSLQFMALVKAADGTPVGKLVMTGKLGGFAVETAPKVDVPIVIILACSVRTGGTVIAPIMVAQGLI